MLFNSFSFLLIFLPITLLGFYWIARRDHGMAAGWLAVASLVFYGWWDYRYLLLLIGSITFNFYLGSLIGKAEGGGRQRLLVIAITTNLLLLAYYKYADFFISSFNDLAGMDFVLLNVVLPIGISFFTFTQIAFLVDTYQGKVREYQFVHYLLFVTYFPHLIAGPVLHHKEMMPQFADAKIYRFSTTEFGIGVTIFVIGLAKKVLIADNLAPHASVVFDAHGPQTMLVVLGGVLAYTFQLYFDFSAYSDMAIGLSRMIGVKLPLNFDSPYKAVNISEFWRRWHMTLSRFLRDYLYIPLGGNRYGNTRRYGNLMTTMLLGGLWHGAGWTFVIWGALHGIYLVINHAWIGFAKMIRFPVETAWWRFFAIVLTFTAVCVAWVFFRAADLNTALMLIKGLSGQFGVALPEAIGNRLGVFKDFLEQMGITFYLGGGERFVETWVWVTVGGFIAFFMPNTQQIMARFSPALNYTGNSLESSTVVASRAVFSPSAIWGVLVGVMMIVSLLSLNRPSEFLYFQF